MSTTMEEPDWSHEVDLPAEPASAAAARDFVARHLVDHQLSYLVDDVRLVVSELVTNSVLHALTPVTVVIRARPFGVMLTVRDWSPSAPVVAVSDVDSTSGRGMEVVEQYSSDWGYSPGAEGDKVVWASFALRPPMMTP